MRNHNTRLRAGNWTLGGSLGVIVIATIVAFITMPHWFRTPIQVPVSAQTTFNFLGFANGIRITNTSTYALKNVQVTGKNTLTNSSKTHYIRDTISGETGVTLYYSNWGWTIEPNEWVVITADGGYLPTTFTAAQLGIK